MPTFKLDGREIPFQPGESIIKAAWRQGIEIPHYCWHPGLSAPANCRMCLVEIKPAENQRALMLDIVEWDEAAGQYRNTRKPKLLPSCQMQAVEGQEVLSETSGHVRDARKYVQEALLLNHPVDCPICDQAGECKLQDYWLEHQQSKKRMREEPVHKPKGVIFGDTIVYDAERCVMCTRCVRFMDEVAKDPVLEMRERGNLNEITVAPGRKLEGDYTLMTAHVCPVGALTSRDFRFKARAWFLRTVKTVCQGCATGCNAYLDYDPRSNRAYRHRPRDNEDVNEFWLCDAGMLSYKRAHEGRITEASVKAKQTSVAQALENAKALLGDVRSGAVALVLSAQHSLEDNWALLQLGAQQFPGAKVFYTGLADGKGDAVLRHPEKNPNSFGVREIAPQAKPVDALVAAVGAGEVSHVLALGGEAVLSDDEVAALSAVSVVVIAAHEGALSRAATVVLPATSWAEHSGTYVNGKGMHQRADKGLEPQGVSKPGWQLVRDLGIVLGAAPSFTKLSELRGQMAGEVGPTTEIAVAP